MASGTGSGTTATGTAASGTATSGAMASATGSGTAATGTAASGTATSGAMQPRRRDRARRPRGRRPLEQRPRAEQPRRRDRARRPRGQHPAQRTRRRAGQTPRVQRRAARVTRAALAPIPGSAGRTLLARARHSASQARTSRVPMPRARAPRRWRAHPYLLAPKRTWTVPKRTGTVPVAPVWQVTARPARDGPVPERRPDGAGRGASSAPWAWMASCAPQAVSRAPQAVSRTPEPRQVLPGTQRPLASEPALVAGPTLRSRRHDRACAPGRASARIGASARNRPRAQIGMGRRALH